MSRTIRASLLFVLLLAAWLRFAKLGVMNGMLMYDEAYNAWDALQLLDNPRLTPFLPDNNGRESGWHYLLLLFLTTVGITPFAVRLSAAMIGLLTVPVVYQLGRELSPSRSYAVGLWSGGTIGVLYWHIHMSHLGLRAILMPLVGSLAFYCLLRAVRTNRWVFWVLGGVWLGTLSYTYFSARIWIVYLGLWIAIGFLQHADQRRGRFAALAIGALLSLPQLVYMVQNPSASLHRVTTVSTFSAETIIQNSIAWLSAIAFTGDPSTELNAFSHPVLHPIFILPFLIGCVAAVRQLGGKHTILLVGFGLCALLPSLISDSAPHFLRAIGLVVPVAVIVGAGFATLTQDAPSARQAMVLCAIFALVGGGALRTLNRWLQADDIDLFMETHTMTPLNTIRQLASTDTSVYFAPFSTFHPNIAFARYALDPINVAGITADHCTILPDGAALYVSTSNQAENVTAAVAQWQPTQLLDVGMRVNNTDTLYEIMQTAGPPAAFADKSAITFGTGLQLRSTIDKTTATPSEPIIVSLAFRALEPQPFVLSAFVHLHGDPSPYDGGTLWAQADSLLCEPYPATIWRPNEQIVQQLAVFLPPDIPTGSYSLNVGVYEAPAGDRLPILPPHDTVYQFAEIGRITITSP